MDPRLKLLAFGFFLCATALLQSLPALLAAFLVAWFWVILARLPLGRVVRRAVTVALFLATFFLILPFSHPMGWQSGMSQAATIVLKGVAMILTIFPMFATAPFHVSVKALERLKLSPKIVTLTLLTYRYFATYRLELQTVKVSLMSRGFNPRGNLGTLRTIGNLIGALLLRSFEQTERIYQSMRSRGYTDRFGVSAEFQPLGASDWSKFGTVISVALALVVLDLR
jgi:cobalt/nickel transport system permease protein